VPVDDLFGVDAHAQRLGAGFFFRLAPTGRWLARGSASDQPQYWLTRTLPCDGDALSRSLISSKQAGLLAAERIRFSGVGTGGLVVPRARAALLAQGLMQALGGKAALTERQGRALNMIATNHYLQSMTSCGSFPSSLLRATYFSCSQVAWREKCSDWQPLSEFVFSRWH
jgi:hypothetical protein